MRPFRISSFFPLMSFFCSRISFSYHIASSFHVSLLSSDLWQFLSLSLYFIILTIFRNTGQVSSRMSSIWVGLMIFSLVWSFGDLERIPWKWIVLSITWSCFCDCFNCSDYCKCGSFCLLILEQNCSHSTAIQRETLHSKVLVRDFTEISWWRIGEGK